MPRRLLLCLCLLGASLVAPAGAATGTGQDVKGTETTATGTKTVATGTKKTPTGTRTSAPRRRGSTVAGPAATTAPPRTVAAPRRLEDIHIEGEIPAPQVLFVTARDQRRFTRFHHDRYLKTSVQVGDSTPLPTRIALTHRPTTPAGAP
jgi:hypothetical protein